MRAAAAVRRLRLPTSRAPPLPLAALPTRRGAASLTSLPPDLRDDVARVLELADRAAASWTTAASDFLRPPTAAAALDALAPLADVAGVAWGGYPSAERCRLVVGRADAIEDAAPALLEEHVAGVRIKGVFVFDPSTHRDFLGAILKLSGLDRRVVGDIVVTGDSGACVFAAPTAADVIAASLDRVRTVRVTATRVPAADLAASLPPPKLVPVRSTEASLRLDAIASAGFRVARSKAADAVRSGDIRLNWREAKPSALVAAGDVISMAGKGRVEVVAVSETKRGRFAVEMNRLA